jgi:hypothetical protein
MATTNLLCHLCRLNPPIENSHLMPAFAYKRYVADQTKGGRFLNLLENVQHNKQLTRAWFCKECEGRFGERHTAMLMDHLDEDRYGCEYTADLLRFATSMALRMCILELTEGDGAAAQDLILRRLRGVWRDHLMDRRPDVRPYTMHACVLADRDSPLPTRIGAEFAYVYRMVTVQIGPLFIFGMLDDKTNAGRYEKIALDRTELTSAGGVLPTITRWEKNLVLTDDMVEHMNQVDGWTINRTNEFNSRQAAKSQ